MSLCQTGRKEETHRRMSSVNEAIKDLKVNCKYSSARGPIPTFNKPAFAYCVMISCYRYFWQTSLTVSALDRT
jgi:hypothetical protein